jgi:hypothetical protein
VNVRSHANSRIAAMIHDFILLLLALLMAPLFLGKAGVRLNVDLIWGVIAGVASYFTLKVLAK